MSGWWPYGGHKLHSASVLSQISVVPQGNELKERMLTAMFVFCAVAVGR
jgi:hypothetical protein